MELRWELGRLPANAAAAVALAATVWGFNAGCASDEQSAAIGSRGPDGGDAMASDGRAPTDGACGPALCAPGMSSRIDLRCVDRDSGVSGPCTANSVLVDGGMRCFVKCGQPGDGALCPACAPECASVFSNFFSPGPDQPGFCASNELLCIPRDHLETCLP